MLFWRPVVWCVSGIHWTYGSELLFLKWGYLSILDKVRDHPNIKVKGEIGEMTEVKIIFDERNRNGKNTNRGVPG